MRDPAVLHHKMVVQYDHPELGPLTLMGQPLRFSETPAPTRAPAHARRAHRRRAAPGGLRRHEIADLRRRGVVAGKDSAPGADADHATKLRGHPLRHADDVATVTLDRPDVHNAMNNTMRRELLEVFTRPAPRTTPCA